MAMPVRVDGYEVAELRLGECVVDVVRPVGTRRWTVSARDWVEALSNPPQVKMVTLPRNIHRAFAAVPRTPDGVVAFANKYGLLGLNDIHRSVLQDAGYSPNDDAELLFNWFGLMDVVKGLLKAHDAGKRWKKLSPSRVVNDYLEKHPARPVLRRNKDGGLDLDIEPPSLMSAIWLDVAKEMADMTVRKLCPGCGKRFWLTSGQRRDTVYCSKACATRRRVAAHRARKRAT